MAEDERPAKASPEIVPVSLEEDSPKTDFPLQTDRIEELKTKREEDRKDADSQHARTRDTWVTIAGLILVLILIIGYFIAVGSFPKNEYVPSLLDLIKAVVMLIIGYIFGTKITHR
jgi:cation transport ATPase